MSDDEVYARERRRAEEIEQNPELNTFRVFLKSGTWFDVEAEEWEVIDEVIQDKDSEDEEYPRPEIRSHAITFFAGEEAYGPPEFYIPFDQVAAIVCGTNAATRRLLRLGGSNNDT